MKILDPYIREILDNSINTSRDIKDFKFEFNIKLSELNTRIDLEEIKKKNLQLKLEQFEWQIIRLETAINQCQDTIGDAFEILDKIRDSINMSKEPI